MSSLRQNAFRALQRDLGALSAVSGPAKTGSAAARELAPTLAQDLGPAIEAKVLSNSETALAFEILQRVAMLLEVSIRAELSRQLAASPLLPQRLALEFARDLDEVALPVIELAQAFTSDDLLEIAQSGSQAKLMALSRRSSVSQDVSAVVVERGGAPEVETLLSNPGANVAESELARAVERFGDEPGVQRALVEARSLPPTVAVKLVEQIAGTLLERLAAKVQIPPQLSETLRAATEAAALGRALTGDAAAAESPPAAKRGAGEPHPEGQGEAAAAETDADGTCPEPAEPEDGAAAEPPEAAVPPENTAPQNTAAQNAAARKLLKALAARGKLTPLLLLRLAAAQRLDLVAEAIAILAGETPLPATGSELEEMLLYGDPFKRRRLFDIADQPSFLFSAFNAALSLMQERAEKRAKPLARAKFEAELLRRLIGIYREVSPGRDKATALDETLARLARAAKDTWM